MATLWEKVEDEVILNAMASSPKTDIFLIVSDLIQKLGKVRTTDSVRNRVARLSTLGKISPSKKVTRNSNYERKKWDAVEDAVLVFAYGAHGEKWRLIKNSYLPSRSDASIRNRISRLRETNAIDCSIDAIFKEFDALC